MLVCFPDCTIIKEKDSFDKLIAQENTYSYALGYWWRRFMTAYSSGDKFEQIFGLLLMESFPFGFESSEQTALKFPQWHFWRPLVLNTKIMPLVNSLVKTSKVTERMCSSEPKLWGRNNIQRYDFRVPWILGSPWNIAGWPFLFWPSLNVDSFR